MRGSGMFVRTLAMFVSRGRVFLRFFVLTGLVMMSRLVMMMCGCVVVTCGLVMVVTRGMLRRLCHLWPSFHLLNNRNPLATSRTVVDWNAAAESLTRSLFQAR